MSLDIGGELVKKSNRIAVRGRVLSPPPSKASESDDDDDDDAPEDGASGRTGDYTFKLPAQLRADTRELCEMCTQ